MYPMPPPRAQRACMRCLLVLVLTLTAGVASAMSPREIADRFDYVLRKSHSTLMTKFTLSTCRFRVEEGTARCAERPRVSVIENLLKFYGDDIRSTAMILEPARERGIAMLNYEYYDPSQDNSAWIYLPALGKVKRIIATQDSDDSGAFFGSEFYIEDLDYRRPDEYVFELLEEVDISTHEITGPTMRPAWVLQWTPTPERARKSKYGRVVTWIDRERHILLKEDLFNHNGQRVKERTVSGLEFVENHWWPKRVVMTNLLTRRVSTIDRLNNVFDREIPDEVLTQRVLTDQPFRERHMNEVRKAWN